jgi:ABC-type transport system involved in multi-copper enzyme maturation permease subunit
MTTFGNLMLAEWTKLRSLRSTMWSLGAMVVLTLGIGILATRIFAGNFDTLDPADKAHLLADPIGLILQPGATYAQIAVCVLGAMLMAGEYASGTIHAGLLAVPRRLPLLAAKAVVFAVVVFVLAELVAVPTFLVGQAALRPHVAVALGDPGIVRALAGLGLYLALTGLFALAIGALVRHVAGAVAAALGIVLVASGLAGLIPGSAGRHVEAWMPANAGQQILSSGHDPGALLSPWQGIGVLGLEAAVLLVLAAWLLLRRDA